MSSPLKLVIFDMDGTLIDSQALIISAMRAGFEAADMNPPTDAETLSIVGLSLHEAITVLRPGLTPAQYEYLVEGYKSAFVKHRADHGGEASIALYPGIRNLLEQLDQRENLLLGVATGKAKRGLDHVYTAHDLGKFFVTSQTADFHPSKPHPAMLEQCLADTGVDACDAVMIGDTSFDIEMGRAAGFRTIAVAWGYHPVSRLRAVGADHVVEMAAEITSVIDEMMESAA